METEPLLRDSTISTPLRAPSVSQDENLQSRVKKAIHCGTEYLFTAQRKELYWCAELESNPTISAEYVFMCQILNVSLNEKRDRLIHYFLNKQNSDGSWGIADQCSGDVSTSAEVYLALRILGVAQDHPQLKKAEVYIRSQGGLEKIRVFTRIFFALFGLVPWDATPVIPAEFIFFPPQFPANIYYLASWARSTMIPLFIIFHHQPVYSLPNGQSKENPWLDHLWLKPEDKRSAFASSMTELIIKNQISWKSFFGLTEPLIRFYDRNRVQKLRDRALKECTSWILERQESSGDWAGIFPPMINGVIALTLQGYSLESDPVRRGLEAIENFAWEDSKGIRIQACVSPVWDTVLSVISLVDSQTNPNDPRLVGAIRWVLDRQLLVKHGDWKVYRPQLESGGWSFEYFNSWYPDIDDTAAVILSMLKQDPQSAYTRPLIRAVDWILGMQNSDGGWAAFDVDNNKLFLNQIPFSDMDSLCDPSSPDVTGRVLEALGLLMEKLQDHEEHFTSQGKNAPEFSEKSILKIRAACLKGIQYLRQSQEKEGSWFGRWGVNYIYGTSNVLCGLAHMGILGSDPMVAKALDWLKSTQNPDGGWGEDVKSYSDKKWMGKGHSTPSQTAWALMGLLNYTLPQDQSIENGISWLVRNQKSINAEESFEAGKQVPKPSGATWEEAHYTGTGFPNHFYLRYNYYRHYFPMMALGRYLRAFAN